MITKARELRAMIASPEIQFLMEAHSGLSSKVVEEAGFKGIWASSLSLSAMMGVRDNNEVSWSQVVDIVETMCDATNIPILLDGDTGYGNFNNARIVIKKIESRGVAGICIEDKVFPKTNSFLQDNRQKLSGIDEFCGKIKAIKDTLSDDDFVVAARVEALIAGLGMSEALKRAEAYRMAGADAIVIHSKMETAAQIFSFLSEWGNRAPIIIIPTTYFQHPVSNYENRGISLIIWANHLIRASLKAMQDTAQKIYETQGISNLEDRIAPLKEVFRIQGDDELLQAEKMYLPPN